MSKRLEICMKCGKGLTRRQITYGRQYCSRECYANARYGDKIRYGNIETRNPLVIEAAKLCQVGYMQVEAAKQLGVHQHTVSDWCVQYGADNFLPERVCEHCGKTIGGMSNLGRRKYCSQSCKNKAKYDRENPCGRQRAVSDPELRMQALELYWGGLSQKSIAKHLNIASGTVYSWVHLYGGQRKRQLIKEILRLGAPEERLKKAEKAEEWVEALRDLTKKNTHRGKRVHLICKNVYGMCGVNILTVTLMDALKLDPLSGEIYAFCDTLGKNIITICWDGKMFHMGRYLKTHGAFIWPKAEWGRFVTVRESEFGIILCYQKIAVRQGGKAGNKGVFMV